MGGIWFVGIVLHFVVLGCPSLIPEVGAVYGLWGGGMRACGNLLVIPVINNIGQSLGICVWGVITMLMGWFMGYFGILGARTSQIEHLWLNLIGVAFAVMTCVVYLFIQPVQPAG